MIFRESCGRVVFAWVAGEGRWRGNGVAEAGAIGLKNNILQLMF